MFWFLRVLLLSPKNFFWSTDVTFANNQLMYSRVFEVRSSLIFRTSPIQRSLRWLMVVYIVVVPLSTSLLVISCCHPILRIPWRHRWCKVSIFFSHAVS